MGAFFSLFLDWRVLLAIGAAAFIGWNRYDAGRAARAERDSLITATKAAHDERVRTNKGWADFARDESIAAATTLDEKDAELAALRQQLKTRRPANVPPPPANAAPRLCSHVPRGFVLQHDAAATAAGRAALPDTVLAPHDAAGAVALDRVSAAVEDNYLTCRADQNRLAELQRTLATLCREWSTRYGHKPETCNPR